MGFNISQIINKIKLDTENPYARKYGQLPISVVEPWEMRMARLGLIKNVYAPSAGTSLTQGSFTTLYTTLGAPEQRAGYNIIPMLMIISANSPGLIQIEFATEQSGTTQYIQKYLGQAGSWEFKPEGLIKTGDLAVLSIKFKADNASSVGWFNMMYAEVSI